MKLKTIFQILGFRGRPRRYGYTIRTFELPRYGRVEYAQWLHPSEMPAEIPSHLLEQYGEFINQGDFCIDIGAHTGDSTLPIALSAGPGGMVLAMEPNPYVFPVLEKNARLNRDLTNIVPMMAAAAGEDGILTFEYSDAGYCNGGRHEGISTLRHGHAFKLQVHGVNLQRELRSDFKAQLPRLKFIKVDTEGYDLHVLKSLAGIIDDLRPHIRAEVYKLTGPGYRAELMSFLLTRQYTVRRVTAESGLAGEIIGPADAMKYKHYDIYCSPA